MDFQNMKSSEITKLVNSQEVKLSELSKKDLEIIFDIESTALLKNKNHSIELLNLCAEELTRYYSDDPEYMEFFNTTITMDDISAICEKGSIRKKKEVYTQRISFKRALLVATLVTLLVAVLSVSCIAIFDPFSRFGLTIREIFDMKSDETHIQDDIILSVSDENIHYDSYDEVVKAVGFDFMWFDEESSEYKVKDIHTSDWADYSTISVIISNNSHQISYSIYYDKGVSERFDERNYKDSQSMIINDNTVYFASRESGAQATIFDDSLVYVITTDSIEIIQDFIVNLN